MKSAILSLSFFAISLASAIAMSWDRHDLLTRFSLEKVAWLDNYHAIQVTSFQSLLSRLFSKTFTEKDFFKQYQLNDRTKIGFEAPESVGETTTAKAILSAYAGEPDWGMDNDLDISPDQKFMGGTSGPTSRAFRHLYWKGWSVRAPLRTFHYPPREMGEALKRAQLFYNLAEEAFKASQPYWAFRFLAWSLHYIQDLGQPFHTSQLLTPKYAAWEHIFHFKKFVDRTTQIISNYHWMYEKYIAYRLVQEIKNKMDKMFLTALKGADVKHSSSAFLIAKHISDYSNHFSYEIGEACYLFFGKKFMDPTVDVPSTPEYFKNISEYDQSSGLSKREKKLFLEKTGKNLHKVAIFTRSLLELAREEFLKE